jgi:hypothetical protein
MGRRLEVFRPSLGLWLVIAACHSGKGWDWADFNLSSTARETRDVGAAEAPNVEASKPDPAPAGVELERPGPRPDHPELASPELSAPIETDGGTIGGEINPDGGYTLGGPSRDGGASDAGAMPAAGSVPDAGPPPPSATQVCPAPGGGPPEVRLLPNAGDGLCWVGESWELGFARASGSLNITERFVEVRAYLFGGAASAKTQVYDADGNPLTWCVAVDTSPNSGSREIAFEHTTCPGAAFARVTAHWSPDGDL